MFKAVLSGESRRPLTRAEKETHTHTQSETHRAKQMSYTHTHVVMEMMEGLGVRWLLSAGRDVWPGKC